MHPTFKIPPVGTGEVKGFSVNIVGLSLKAHHFDFELNDAFFKEYGVDQVTGGKVETAVILDKKETFIDADFRLKGHVGLICDRCLEPFDFPIDVHAHIVFKYGDEDVELSDEVVVIRRDRDSLDLGQYFYEFIVLEIPMKKLHPKFAGEEDDENIEGKMIYRSTPDEDSDSGDIDPRWEQLKKLK